MASAKVDNPGGFGFKRSRNDVSVREGDWTCLKCGNVNFSFRNVCNRTSCGAPRPSASPSPRLIPIPPPIPAGYGHRSPLYYGGAGGPPPMHIGSNSYGAPYPHFGPRYGYGPVGPPSNYGLFPSYGSPGPVGGMVYGPLREMGRVPEMGQCGYVYHRASPMPVGPVSSPWPPGGAIDMNDISSSRKRRGGPDGLSEGDWICPKCDNVNFSFRMNCNMKKCGAPRPSSVNASGGVSSRTKEQQATPEGSWTCTKCNNLNYPFRTVCNRKGCGAERSNAGK